MERKKLAKINTDKTGKQFVGIKFTPRSVRTPGDLASTLITGRLTKGMTQAELAKKIGVSQSAISLFEKRGSDLQFSTLMRLLNSLGMEMIIGPMNKDTELDFESIS